MNPRWLLLPVLLGLATLLPAPPEERAKADLRSSARRFIEIARTGNITGAHRLMAEPFARTLNNQATQRIFSKLSQQGGRFETCEEPFLVASAAPSTVYAVGMVYEHGKFTALVTFESADYAAPITAMRVVDYIPGPGAAAPADEAPPYAEPLFFRELPAVVTRGRLELPARISVPSTARPEHPVPAALVVGLGNAGDVEGSLGAVHASRDLAQGLASRGVACLRMETRDHAVALEGLVDERPEPLDSLLADVLAARAHLAARTELSSDTLALVVLAPASRLALLRAVADAAGSTTLAVLSTGGDPTLFLRDDLSGSTSSVQYPKQQPARGPGRPHVPEAIVEDLSRWIGRRLPPAAAVSVPDPSEDPAPP